MTSPPYSPAHDSHHDDFGGRARDMAMDRRRALRLFAGAGVGVVALAACGGSDSSSSSTAVSTAAPGTDPTTVTTDTVAATSTTAGATSSTDASCTSTIPSETAGPYPGDGSNGPDVLGVDGVVRQDIRSSIGGASGTAEGLPLTVNLTVVDTANGCAPLAGAAVYLWHATAEGKYSMYSEGVTDQNYLRGVQVADADGNLSFTTVHPGCYDGRWPHIHFEVYPSVDDALAASNLITTSQLAFPRETCEVAYTYAGYETSVSNLSRVSLETDMVFADGWEQQLATMGGDLTSGFTAALTVPV